jgi:hypothetical protein
MCKSLAVLFAVARANEHARILSLPVGAPKVKVFTTTLWHMPTNRAAHQPQRLASRNPTFMRGSNMTRITQNYQLLANLG